MNYSEMQPEPGKPRLEPVELPPGAKWLAIGLVLAVVLGILALTIGPWAWKGWREHQILNNGTDATAKLLKIVDTGDRFNDNPVVQLSVEVQPEGRGPYRATIETALSAVDLKHYEVGEQIRVRYDPEDPKQVVLVGPIK